MTDPLNHANAPVIPVWGLMPDECLKIIAQAQKFILQGRASDVTENRRRAYIRVFDRHGAPYTVCREQRILHLLDPGGETIAISKKLDVIIDALDASLSVYN